MKTLQLSFNNTEVGLLNKLVSGVKPTSTPSAVSHENTGENEWVIQHHQQQSHQSFYHEPQQTSTTSSGLTRSKTAYSLSASSTSTVSSCHGSSLSLLQKEDSHAYAVRRRPDSSMSSLNSASAVPSPLPSPDFTTFGMDLRRYTCESPTVPIFDSGMRQVLEPHLRKARLAREEARKHRRTSFHVHDSIASSVGVPYVRLRSERPFLYDTYTHPMHQILAETLGVDDLSQLHLLQKKNDGRSSKTIDSLEHLLAPLKCRESRFAFQESYDNFVTSFCIPLLHSMAMSHNLFHGVHSDSENTRISYRYQAFPNIRIMRPGDASPGPRCLTSQGHNVGFLHFHIPLTPSFGTNAVYTESHPGKEDWHPMQTKSIGLGFLLDGARCIHFNMENTTDSTLVALDFVVAIYYADGEEVPIVDPDGLCNQIALEDFFSLSGQGYYDEAVIDIRPGSPLWQCVAKKRDGKHKLLDPDSRNGFPFPAAA
ncbi:hypothetical protein IV203_000918 [Nitzschia inconspicua]|uniref:Uncharacterized protein n=1 Tax=Nitzschia inconspicua TaxID=303405 RepID=A0A9K3PQP9_9STRA|nr:hypothetical protein IV203_000918 [Nitzschia inconspicua]